MNDEVQLIEEYLNGSDSAAEVLIGRYQRQVYALAYRMTGNIEESKDLTQITFVKALEGLKKFRKESSLRTWLYQIAVNACLNHMKRYRNSIAELDESFAGGESGALTLMIDNEKKDHVKRGLATLPQRQRLAVILRVYDSLSCADTARVMGCSEGAVKAHYHHGVRKLQEYFKEKGYEIKA